MDFKTIIQKFESTNLDGPTTVEISNQVANKVLCGELKIIDLVKELDGVLTNANHEIRLRGVELLTKVMTSLSKDALNEQEIQVLCEFLCLKLIDYKTMEKPVLRCLLYFIGCTNKPQRFNKTLLEVLKTKANVQKMDIKSRSLVYEIINRVLIERRQSSDTIDSDLIYSLVHMIEGENNPENILKCFRLVSYVLKNFQDLEPFIDDLFEWLASYYPLDYTPGELTDAQTITRSDLVQALYDCFYAHQHNAANLQTLLLEKLDDNLVSTKIESLNCLIKCYEVFPVGSIKEFSSTLWTFVRMTCLKKIDLVDPTLLQLCYKALGSMTLKLSEDDEFYFRFISEMYDELSMAFKKPEMDLFEPAARLLAHAVSPRLYGFNHILARMLPISLNALASNEFRPISGLAYIFEILNANHPKSRLISDLSKLLDKLVVCIIERAHIDCDNLRLLNAMIYQGVDLQANVINALTNKLISEIWNSSLDLEGCLARLCINYDKPEILFDETKCDFKLGSLIKMISFYRERIIGSGESACKTVVIKFSIYLRLLNIILTEITPESLKSLNQDELNNFLTELRKIIMEEKCWALSDKVGQLHALVLNKIDDELANPLLMPLFSSNYCQSLVPNSEDERKISYNIYVPVIRWILKSLVVRNHKLSSPIINLLLNFITSPKVDERLALLGSQVFKFVQSGEEFRFEKDRHFKVFFLHKQKFYSTASGEIKIRYAKQEDNYKKYLLICALAVQIPYLPWSVYKNDYEWLMRELLRVLSSFKEQIREPQKTSNEELVAEIFDCLVSLIRQDAGDKLSGLIESLINLGLVFAQEAKTLRIRRQALDCLAIIATTIDHSDLMNLRGPVCTKLKSCLSDRKRLVRQSAAEARLRWILIGQPLA